MGRLAVMVYNGKSADNMTKDELIAAILKENNIEADKSIVKAMEEAFRVGFLRGEEYSN